MNNAKFDLWERKLLDLSMRNTLLNAKLSRLIPIYVPDPAKFEDMLAQDGKIKLLPASESMQIQEDQTFEALEIRDNEEVTKAFEEQSLYTAMKHGALDDKIKDMARKAKVAEEENGANTLYIALGFIKWFDKGATAPAFAPILLIPVELTRTSIVAGYRLKRRDEDTELNITILEKLKQDFELDIPDFAGELPQDEHGLDTQKIFEVFEAATATQQNWKVVKSAALGMFSFTQFVMWNDLHNNRDKIAENKVVASLLEGAVTWDDGLTIDEAEEEDVMLPLVADASQINAIKAAGDGKSFVLHGPPGTGKSQTITSMIADSLAKGKKVLFVAEKKAALDVVYARLEKIGIAPFCLELHSNKAKKSHLLEQLRVVAELSLKSTPDGDYDKKLADLTQRRKELDAYATELHKVQSSGYTLFEMLNVYGTNKDAPDCGQFSDALLNDITEEQMQEIESALGELTAGQNVPELKQIKGLEYRQQFKTELPQKAQQYEEKSQALKAALQAQNIQDDKQTIDREYELAKELIKLEGYPNQFRTAENPEEYFGQLQYALEQQAKAETTKAELLTDWTEDFLSRDPAKLTDEFDEAEGKWGPAKSIAHASLYKKIKVCDKTDGKVRDNLRQHFVKLNEFQKTKEKAEETLAKFQGIQTDKATVEAAKETITKIDGMGGRQKRQTQTDAEQQKLFVSAYEEYKDIYSGINADLNFERGEDFGTVQEADAIIQTVKDNEDKLRQKITFNNLCGKCRSLGVANLVTQYEEGTIQKQDLVPAFRKSVAKSLITKYIDASEPLRTFSSDIFDEKIRQFKQLDEDFIKITRQEIYMRLRNRIPDIKKDVNAKSAIGLLQKAIKNHGRGVSIRSLFTQMPELIADLCPCMLMSPISVAQYLEPGNFKFDTVIFDEASQLPTCKAVGVIARGNNAVIVGDPKQMPPTSFFQSENFDEENYEIEDLESILDDCLAISMPQTHLLWHYRSRHESLITFSNRCFYDGRLYTFPSSDSRRYMVNIVDIGGTFDRGKTRTNEKEAIAIVDEIENIYKDREKNNSSVGVVTFNISQQHLIDDLLTERCRKDGEFEKWVYASEEPVFIKNLENVQGDERDIILFSVAYGTDGEGKSYMNFGPLNREGGWRRLNVAVTRARKEMKVFSSLKPEEIKTNVSTSEGVIAFKRFLQYAEGSPIWSEGLTTAQNGEENTPILNRADRFTGIADSICEELNQRGCKTQKNVGNSAFKIDIGIEDPDNDTAYTTGILLDGHTYFESKTTSCREITQPDFLKGLGWNIYRVRSLEWWEDPTKVADEIEQVIKQAQTQPEESAPSPVEETSEEQQPQSQEEQPQEEQQPQAEQQQEAGKKKQD